jgi:hypothetical protein
MIWKRMKMKTKNTLYLFLAVFTLVAQLFGSVPTGRAQSSRDWSDPVNISNSGSSDKPVIVIGNDGIIHAIWNPLGGGFRYSRSSDGGVTWTPPRSASFPFSEKDDKPFKIIPSPDGAINLFWVSPEGNLMFGRANSETLPVPTSWASKERVGDDVLNYNVDVTEGGVFHLAYIRKDEKAGVYYRRSQNGAVWSKPITLFTSKYFESVLVDNQESIKVDDAHVRVSASDDVDEPTVFVAWDVRRLKRIFIASSVDGGENFTEAAQLKGPEDTGGYGIPLNVELGVNKKNAVLLYQVGEAGASQCVYYSQVTSDAGETWSNPTLMLDTLSQCPVSVEFIITQDNFFMTLIRYDGNDPAIMAWQDGRWGNLQFQREIASFSNPLTFDPIVFRCEEDALFEGKLYLVGCDLGNGGDIWMTARSLEPLDQWFGSTESWSFPFALLDETNAKVGSLTQVSDDEALHTVWSESTLPGPGGVSHSLSYARWDGDRWAVTRGLLWGLNGKPLDLSMAISQEGNLFVTWVNESTGSVIYSLVDASRAGFPADWADPKSLPSPSTINSAPDILVDGSGLIVVVYAVPFNEERGIYMVKSSDRGGTWSAPVKVFDGVAGGWDITQQPKVSVSGDGSLHVIFVNSNQSQTENILYYVRSIDGGTTWSEPELVSEKPITWLDTITYGDQTVHRFWQENYNDIVSSFDQVSNDGGLTWSTPIEMAGVTDHVTPVALVQRNGDLHFLRTVEKESTVFLKEANLMIEDWEWDGSGWSSTFTQVINVQGDKLSYSMTGGLAGSGELSALVQLEYTNLENESKYEVRAVNRAAANTFSGLSQVAVVGAVTEIQIPSEGTPQPVNEPVPTASFVFTEEPSVFSDTSLRNGIGLALVAVVILLGVVFFRRNR